MEPELFRFLRVQSGVGEALGGASLTCIAVLPGSIALGMSTGEVIVSTLAGVVNHRWRAHATPVNGISACSAGEYVASCSDDGNVIVRHLVADPESTKEGVGGEVESHPFDQPLTCVQLDPSYGKRSEKCFVAAGPQGQLIVSRKTWFSQRDAVIHEGEGPVASVAWSCGSLVAWANDR